MKSVVIGVGTIILSVFVFLSVSDLKIYQREHQDLKSVCEELSATGALYVDMNAYAEGNMVFNHDDATLAIQEQLKSLLSTDDSFTPLPNSYWRDDIDYKIYFWDDSNSTFPCLFTDPDTGYTVTLSNPAVIVTINAGSGRFHFPEISGAGNAVRTASHEWQQY